MSALKKYLCIISFNIACISFSLITGYMSIYELFIQVPGVNVPRIILQSNDHWQDFKVDFQINIPTVTNIVVLVGSIICIYTSLILSWKIIKSKHRRRQKYRVAQVTSIFVIILALAINVIDFFSKAGTFG